MKSNSIKNNNSNSNIATRVHRDRITNLLNRRNNNTNNPEAVNENANIIRHKTSLPSNSGTNISKVETTYDMVKNVIQLRSVTSLGEIEPNQTDNEATKTDKQQKQKTSSSSMQSSSSSNVTLSSSSTNGFSSPKQSDTSSNNQAYKNKTTKTPTEKSRNIKLVYLKSKH